MKTATLAELGLDSVPFPQNFQPRFLAKDNVEDCWYVFEQQPSFDGDGMVWRYGPRIEIGVGDDALPAMCRGLTLNESLFQIVNAEAYVPRVETMQRLCWETFSVRYNNAERAELERFSKLNAAWDEWQAAWCAGIEAHISTLN